MNAPIEIVNFMADVGCISTCLIFSIVMSWIVDKLTSRNKYAETDMFKMKKLLVQRKAQQYYYDRMTTNPNLLSFELSQNEMKRLDYDDINKLYNKMRVRG